MTQDEDLDRLSSQELHDVAVSRAKRHLDVRFFWDLMRLLPVAEAAAGELGEAETDVMRLSAHVDDVAEAGYGDRFIHRVGHGIGVSTHEPPYMVEGEEHPIEPGMCFSIEPGIYLTGRFGVRIEDIVVATDDGGRRLNQTSHDMRIVG